MGLEAIDHKPRLSQPAAGHVITVSVGGIRDKVNQYGVRKSNYAAGGRVCGLVAVTTV